MALPGAGTGFQSFVNKEPPPAVQGDFAGANIKANIIAGPFGFAASPGGVTIGNIGWFNPATGIASTYYQPSSFCGFVHRDQQGLITTFLSPDTVAIVGGDMATGMDQGDFWGSFPAGATVGQKVYANPTTGALTSNATGNSVTASLSSAGASIAAASGSTPAVLTTTDADLTGTIAVGQIVTDSGTTIPPGTYISASNGTSGGTHLWYLANYDGATIPTVAAGSLTWTLYGVQETQFYVAQGVLADCLFTATLAVPVSGVAFSVLDITSIASGLPALGMFISATGGGGIAATANIQILQTDGATLGSTGNYFTTPAQTAVTSTNTFVGTFGKQAKISTWATQL